MEEQKYISITITPYGCGLIVEALRVLAESDERSKADATSLKVRFQEAALREERRG